MRSDQSINLGHADAYWRFVGWMGLWRDGQPMRPGQTYRLSSDECVNLKRWGFVGYRQPLEALPVARGAIVCHLQLAGQAERNGSWTAASEAKVIWTANVRLLLHTYACDVAEAALELLRTTGIESDPRCWDALAAKRRWIVGDLSDSDLLQARHAAHDVITEAKAATPYAQMTPHARATCHGAEACYSATSRRSTTAAHDTAVDAVHVYPQPTSDAHETFDDSDRDSKWAQLNAGLVARLLARQAELTSD